MTALRSLKQFFKPRDVTIALLGDPFVVIDREQAIGRLRLDERAAEDGGREMPPTDAGGIGAVESEIVAELADHAHRAQIDASNNFRVYGQRLSELALLRELSSITGASEQTLGDFRTKVINSQGRLSLARDAIRDSYRELAAFKREHGLERTAHKGLLPAYAWSLIIVSWLLESAGNTAFLRVNDDFGVIGGFVAAAAIAAVNVFLSALIGRSWWPYLFHKSRVRRVLAIIGTSAWALGLAVWNLLAAHYRDAKSQGLESPELQALSLLADQPIGLISIYSYGLFVLGITFAILSAVAGFKMDDPYPGFGAIYRRHEERCEDYADEIEDAMDELRETRDDGIQAAVTVRDQLRAQFSERGQILASRDTLRLRYREHQEYLETIGSTLLEHYRSGNRQARQTPVPPHFRAKWRMPRNELPLVPDEPTINAEVSAAQEALERSIETIGRAYQEAIESFEHLDGIKATFADG